MEVKKESKKGVKTGKPPLGFSLAPRHSGKYVYTDRV
jgi:hypothetical protein